MSGIAEVAFDNLQSALDNWNTNYGEIFNILTTSPEDFQGGVIWGIVSNILTVLQGIGVSLLIIFFFYGLIKSGIDYRDVFRNPKNVVFTFLRVIIAEFFVVNALDILLYTLNLIQGIMAKIQTTTTAITFTVPDNLKTALENADFWASIGALATSLIACGVVWALSLIIMILVYGKFYEIVYRRMSSRSNYYSSLFNIFGIRCIAYFVQCHYRRSYGVGLRI